jgi:8-oxo-dGTP pyrophosphatase MutT (NUDIX family)
VRAIQTFEVSLKAAIFRDGRLLLLQEADTGYWELPGGRIDVGEEWLAHTDILAREMVEELGPDFRVRWRHKTVSWVRQRPTDSVYQFLVARLAVFEAGPQRLSGEHRDSRWTTPADWTDLRLPPRSGYVDGLNRLWALKPL